ncbi:uncharacterized protein LOC117338972 [Pecten maximus]|uniref:uncharacterized protein LOC117338972 n=1 Tax=Pecten maximus TaxID=6579 RepID=UPI00145835FA|nr:uncharacterized protein LOC117338972 [Pecten maximus]
MDERDKEKTAFSVGNLGFWETNRMGFGLCFAGATFQRMIEKCMGDMHLRECLIFLDDILIFSRTFDEHLTRLESVFARLVQHGLKLKSSKCEFFKTSVAYLGHVVSKEGIATDPEKVCSQELASTSELLAYADISKPFILHTDASILGLGAVLYQKHEDDERVIAYASRGLRPSERNYPAHKLEFLALKYALAIPCKNQKAYTTAKALYEKFIVYYSFPERLHSDQGRNFESEVIKQLCKVAGVKKTRTTPYHPMGNGSAERLNKTLIGMLATLDESQKKDWRSYVAPMVQAYNATRNDAKGYSPHFLMFGWHPRLSVDAFLGTDPGQQGAVNPRSYIGKLRNRMDVAYKAARNEANKNAQQNKVRYDRKVRDSKLEVGDRVLVRKVGLKGKNKLADRWEQEPCVVINIPNSDIPVYKVTNEGSRGKSRTLHRNMLLPFNSIPLEVPPKVPVRKLGPTKQLVSPDLTSSSDSDTETELLPVEKSSRVQTRLSLRAVSSHQIRSRIYK